jgi:hypothetical protein
MHLPLDQWQFYVVSAVALAGLWLLVRPFLRRSTKRKTTPLTIEGKGAMRAMPRTVRRTGRGMS